MWREYPSDQRYLVSDKGAIRGARGWILKSAPVTGGYLTVNVSGHTRKVAHIVAETWIGPRPDGHEVAHVDGNNQNNKSSNLKYETKSENERDKVRHGTSNHGSRNGRSKLTDADVKEIRELLSNGVTQKTIAEKFRITQGNVSRIKRGLSW